MLTYIHSPHTLGRILLPIIDDFDNYLVAILGSSSRSLGVPVSLWLIRNWRSVKAKKMNKKGVDVRLFFFFSGLAVLKFLTKVIMLLMNIFCQNIT